MTADSRRADPHDFRNCASQAPVGDDTLRRSWQVLKPGGRLVTVAAESESEVDERVQQAFFIVEPNRTQLVEVGKLLEEGKLRVMLDSVLPVSAATEAYAGTLARQGRGKLVVSTRQWASGHDPALLSRRAQPPSDRSIPTSR
jgi:D-arabinose 1-dehydrogenase-like Zn-dependent alcohol dehydrogenase